jgi:hypothetical protein
MTRAALVLLAAVASTAGAIVQSGPEPPELPRLWMKTEEVPASGRTIAVRPDGDFQTALDLAQPGDVITLEAGAIYEGPFTLPAKRGSGWIVVRTSAPPSELPPQGGRVSPAHAAAMPKLVSSSRAVLTAAPGAHHYRFVGVEIRPEPKTFLYQLVDLGTSARSDRALPHNLIFDRVYVHGDPVRGARRAFALNSRTTAIIDSYISDCKEVGADSQAIGGWGGPGPFKIVNNYLEAAGENVMFGGAVPSIAGVVPSDIEVRRNHFAKPLSWRIGHPSYAGMPWTVKNLFELKNARRVLVEGNLFEHNWPHAQNGFAILLTVRSEDGQAPWAAVHDVAFVNNTVRHVASGVNVLGKDGPFASEGTRRIRIANNLFVDVGGAWGGGRLFQLLAGPTDIAIEQNTAIQTENIITADGDPVARLTYRDNITPHNDYGIFGSGTGVGGQTIATYFPGGLVQKNVIAGGNPRQYPQDNFFPASLAEVGFVNPALGDYRLSPSSRYRRRGTGGRDPGADIDAINAARHGTAAPSAIARAR